MVAGKSGFVEIPSALSGKEAFLAFAPLKLNGWSVGLVYPRDELYAEIGELLNTVNLMGVVGTCLLLLVSFVVAAPISRPLVRMADATARVAEGNLEIDLSDINSKDEVGRLARAFTSMTASLKRYIRDLTEATAAKQKIESELRVASEIQKSRLPSVFPAYPDRSDFDVYAMMEPAKEVGGDFYYFFLVDDDHLCFCIGDVSGKGVPAALIMTLTIELIRDAASEGYTPDAVLKRANRHLCRGNDTCMFVTVFCAILDLRDGTLTYSNAGHDPALIIGKERGVRSLNPPGGPVLGIMEDATFTLDRIALLPEDVVLAYTDGVTEAFNPSDEQFSRERLIMALGRSGERTANGLIGEVLEAVRSFAQGVPPGDDTTMVAVKYEGRRDE
ncbi:MAG: SpoIIE family protein phosphatase, partial [Pseudomonadota bacterium]